MEVHSKRTQSGEESEVAEGGRRNEKERKISCSLKD